MDPARAKFLSPHFVIGLALLDRGTSRAQQGHSSLLWIGRGIKIQLII